jgi:tripartite ATP-independent transporter DctM subunit
MIIALGSGFPLAFALPGSAILSISIAGIAGFIIEGNANEYFVSDGPFQWLNAGITNFRGVYWEVERDTLIAIPLFIFMGIMLQKSKIAEDLLISMGQLFGPVPGGLGISVIFVGALLAATTGIVGATVVAMGLISLPAMMKNNYNKSLASGIVCASGTLGQIIPPSIVLIILSDQLASASDAADNLRIAEYKNATGSMDIPSQFSVDSVSAGNMFLGAFLPGLVLVSLYMLYVLFVGIFNKEAVPPVKYTGKYNINFINKIILSLVPPLALIFIVLGSILMGIATVNQAGAIGAVGATVMGSYRLYEKNSHKFTPAIISILSLLALFFLVLNFDLNIKTISNNSELIVVLIAAIFVISLLFSVMWSFWRTYKTNNVLKEVMLETSITTSMVFIILIGAAMLTAAFRGFGGEEIVKNFLTSLPGGFWAQFIVVMTVIFVLGFFLDFIEIAVVVVPIVAPILLADTSANITAVWLGVMIGVNMQTSFLTPPFGFSLFYLRGVAPKSIKTTEIWKGASVFIILQLVGLGVVGYFPQLVNYLPLRSYLTSEVSPPPINSKIQECLFDYKYEKYIDKKELILSKTQKITQNNLDLIDPFYKKKIHDLVDQINLIFKIIEDLKKSENNFNKFSEKYKSLHTNVRKIEKKIIKSNLEIEKLNKDLRIEENFNTRQKIEDKIIEINEYIEINKKNIPEKWIDENKKFKNILLEHNKLKLRYNKNVDSSYINLTKYIMIFEEADNLKDLLNNFDILLSKINNNSDKISEEIKSFEKKLNSFGEINEVTKYLSKARKKLKKNFDKKNEAVNLVKEAKLLFINQINWRERGKNLFLEIFKDLEKISKNNFGLRKQEKLSKEQALFVASCRAKHKDISLNF